VSARRAIVLQHTATEGPGRLAALLGARNIAVDVRALHAGARVPDDLAPDEILILMGGPMGVGDAGSPRFPFLAPEIALLEKLVARDAPVLGICLGAQLLAAGAGARVYPNTRPGPAGLAEPAREVGWGPVDFLDGDPPRNPGTGSEPPAMRSVEQSSTSRDANREPALAGLGARELVLHWHGDTFDLPRGAVLLASTAVCKHQAFRLGRRQFGLQFHCELDPQTVGLWVREDADYVRSACGPEGAAQILADTERYYVAARPIWDRLLGNILTLMQ
jgi:GMP synthase-like glutamine amidotransferase